MGLRWYVLSPLFVLANLLLLQVPDYASNLGELLGMGYPLRIAAGSLVLSKNDLRAATELCLTLNIKA
jgi:hypothetical protein